METGLLRYGILGTCILTLALVAKVLYYDMRKLILQKDQHIKDCVGCKKELTDRYEATYKEAFSKVKEMHDQCSIMVAGFYNNMRDENRIMAAAQRDIDKQMASAMKEVSDSISELTTQFATLLESLNNIKQFILTKK